MCRARLGDQMVAFARRWPDIEIGVHEMARASLLLALRAGDIAVAVLPEEEQAGLRSMRLWQDRVMLAARPGHRLLDRPRIAPDDIVDEVFLVSRDPHAGAMHRFLMSRILGVEPSRSLLVDLNETGLMGEVAAGKGVALVCGSQSDLVNRSIALRPIDAADAAFWTAAYWRDEPPAPALDQLLDGFRSASTREA